MTIADILHQSNTPRFSLEVLPPLRGQGTQKIFNTIEHLLPYNPAFVSVTSHRTDYIYKETAPGTFARVEERLRPGTVAVAYAIKQKFGIPVVPHLICSGYNQQETEYELIDLALLEMRDILVLRGDKSRQDNHFIPKEGGFSHASELCQQVNLFNQGELLYGEHHQLGDLPFCYGVAGYPEKHEEAMNMDTDMAALKQKVDMGAQYVLTQMCFDSELFLRYTDRCRKAGIEVPILPGIKPLSTLNHLHLLPATFRVNFPTELSSQLQRCTSNDDVRKVGIEWAIRQANAYKQAGVPCVHFYTMNNPTAIAEIVKTVF